MKILIYSSLFYPSVGGIEKVTEMLATELSHQGQEVKLICQTGGDDSPQFPFQVYRYPTAQQFLDLMGWCDLYWQSCVNLKGIWPYLIRPKPLVINHHTWYRRPDGSMSWQDTLKMGVTHWAKNIAVSEAIAQRLPVPSTVIENPYQDDIFYQYPNIKREKELIFVGRLVSDKGADLLLESLHHLQNKGLKPQLTIVGTGPDEPLLQQKVVQWHLQEQVKFVGLQSGENLAKLLNAHAILVVPSRWQEPFGIVALEGIACGCVVVGSEGGGLKDAIGKCGITFPNNDQNSLTKILDDLLTNSDKLKEYRAHAASHLQRHTKEYVAKLYLKVLEAAIL